LENKKEGLQLATIDPEMMFRRLVEGRLKIEFAYYRLTNNVVFFCDVWSTNEVLCTVQDDQLVSDTFNGLEKYIKKTLR